MSYTLNQTIAWSQSMLGSYIPLTANANEPALSIANMVVTFMNSPPWTWATNRQEIAVPTMTPGTQDYTVNANNFGFLEKVTLTNPATNKAFEVGTIYNSKALGISTEQVARPHTCSVKAIVPGTSFSLRFLSAPDLAYTGVATYQLAPMLFTLTTQDWFSQCNVPQSQMHIYNNLFLAEAFEVNGDVQDAATYRRRGMAALLATAEGLTEMQKSVIFAQAMFSDLQTLAAQMRTQAAGQARTI